MALATEAPNLDIKPLEGRPGWFRLQTGDYRTLYRRMAAGELRALGAPESEGYLIGRVVNRRDLARATATL